MTRKYHTDYGKTLFVTEKFYLLFFLCMKRTTENTFDFSPKKCCNLEKICYNEFQMKEVPVRYLHSFCVWISCRLFLIKQGKELNVMKVEMMMTSTNLYTTFTSSYNWLFGFSYSNLGYSPDGGNKFVCRNS